jgi:hypothetical protein
MDALHDAYRTLLNILELRVGRREQMELLRDRLALVATRDDGRGCPHRRHRSPPARSIILQAAMPDTFGAKWVAVRCPSEFESLCG